jgi:probable O-glycosylation ligase (exosortase A-associated)
MRDIILSLIVAIALPMTLKFPEIGTYLWAWFSIMNPHKLTYGFANNAPFAMLAAATTMVAFVVTKTRKAFPWSAVTVLYLLLIFWMTVTSAAAVGLPEYVWDRWIFVMKIHVMMMVTLMLLRGRRQIETLVWVVVGSVAFFGIKGGLFTIATGGGSRVWGPPGGMLEGNNEVAVALTMFSPLIWYFMVTATKRWVKGALALSLVLIALAVLGTQSRGALIALLAMAFVLGLKSKRPVRASFMIMVLVILGIGFMPDSWTTRMDTIQEYKGDTSAMSRIYTWITMWNLAIDRPLVGGGFGTDTLNVFSRWAPVEHPYNIFTGTVWVAHSIYFQALGEHGFVGLALFLSLGVATWFSASSIIRATRDDPEFKDWVPLLMRMTQVGLVGYAAGGAFLSLMHLDAMYYVVAVVVLTQATVRERQRERARLLQTGPAWSRMGQAKPGAAPVGVVYGPASAAPSPAPLPVRPGGGGAAAGGARPALGKALRPAPHPRGSAD